jgi:hypothetical protein
MTSIVPPPQIAPTNSSPRTPGPIAGLPPTASPRSERTSGLSQLQIDALNQRRAVPQDVPHECPLDQSASVPAFDDKPNRFPPPLQPQLAAVSLVSKSHRPWRCLAYALPGPAPEKGLPNGAQLLLIFRMDKSFDARKFTGPFSLSSHVCLSLRGQLFTALRDNDVTVTLPNFPDVCETFSDENDEQALRVEVKFVAVVVRKVCKAFPVLDDCVCGLIHAAVSTPNESEKATHMVVRDSLFVGFPTSSGSVSDDVIPLSLSDPICGPKADPS